MRGQLDIFMHAARKRARRSTTCCCSGRPAGQDTLAHIIAREMGVNLRQTSGPVLERRATRRAADQPEANDVLFIDEIHRLSPVVEEILYPALEDYQIDIMIGEARPRVRSSSTCSRSRWSAPPRAPAC